MNQGLRASFNIIFVHAHTVQYWYSPVPVTDTNAAALTSKYEKLVYRTSLLFMRNVWSSGDCYFISSQQVGRSSKNQTNWRWADLYDSMFTNLELCFLTRSTVHFCWPMDHYDAAQVCACWSVNQVHTCQSVGNIFFVREVSSLPFPLSKMVSVNIRSLRPQPEKLTSDLNHPQAPGVKWQRTSSLTKKDHLT
ncbi:hypothetical protein ABZP36_011976 [Zizania latifolia]